MKLPAIAIEKEYVNFSGGIDRITNAISIKPGFALDAMNYEVGINGGYKRIDGFERIDGRAAPSDAAYYTISILTLASLAAALRVGMGVVGGTSGATAIIASVPAVTVAPGSILLSMVISRVVGTFVSGEALLRGGGGLPFLLTMTQPQIALGPILVAPAFMAAAAGLPHAQALNAAADIARSIIGQVPGSGLVRGVNLLKGVLYAFRDNEIGTACQMWKATATGWQFIPLGWELLFSSGTTALVEGATITGGTSGATAVITRVAVQTGTLAGSNATGRLIFATKTGDFQDEQLKIGAALVAIAPAPATQITMLPGGRFEFSNFNFSGSTDTMRMYGADGVNRGFESDGTVFVPIVTGMLVDTPSQVHAHKNQLFFSFRGSNQNSGIGQPYKWTAVVGANEIGVGDLITGYASQTGDVLAIFARNRTDQLAGSSVTDFVLKPLSTKSGAIAYTVQTLGNTLYFDDQGVRQITRTQEYGSFNDDPVSQIVQPIIDILRGKVVASSVYRARAQYRVYGNDGSGLIITNKTRPTQFGGMIQVPSGITEFQYPVNVTCACSGEDATGKDVVFFGASNGYVYQGDKGSSFDGEEIEAFVRLPFNHSKSPRTRKRYRKLVLEMTSVSYAALTFIPEFTYGDFDVATHRSQAASVAGVGGYYDSAIYEQIVYDGRLVNAPEFSIEGTGTNMSALFYSKSDLDLGHTLQGALVHFTPRRDAR